MGFFNVATKRELEQAVADYNEANQVLLNFIQTDPAKNIDVDPKEATAEERDAVLNSNKKILGMIDRALEAAEYVRQLGVQYHSSSGPLLYRRPRSKEWNQRYAKEIASLSATRLKVEVTTTFYGGDNPSDDNDETAPKATVLPAQPRHAAPQPNPDRGPTSTPRHGAQPGSASTPRHAATPSVSELSSSSTERSPEQVDDYSIDYDLTEWTSDERKRLTRLLDAKGVPFSLRNHYLVVDREYESEVDHLLDSLTITSAQRGRPIGVGDVERVCGKGHAIPSSDNCCLPCLNETNTIDRGTPLQGGQKGDVCEEPPQSIADDVISAYSVPAPMPLIWWETEVERQGRRRCRQIHSDVYNTASKTLHTYAATFQVHLVQQNLILGVAKDGKAILNSEQTLLGMVDSHHRAFMEQNGLSPIMKDPQVSHYVDFELLSWYLVYGWCAGMFRTTLFKDGQDESTLHQRTRPDFDAMCYADAAMIMLERRDSPITAWLCADVLTVTREDAWGSPPWQFR
jgi:hypothetical protein